MMNRETAVCPPPFIWQIGNNGYEKLLTDAEVTQALDEAIAALPEKFRIVFVLREVEGLTTQETAEITNLSLSATKVRLHRARLFLREHLTQSLLAIGSL